MALRSVSTTAQATIAPCVKSTWATPATAMRKAVPAAIASKENNCINQQSRPLPNRKGRFLYAVFVKIYPINIFLSIALNCLLFQRGWGIIKG